MAEKIDVKFIEIAKGLAHNGDTLLLLIVVINCLCRHQSAQEDDDGRLEAVDHDIPFYAFGIFISRFC
jgi:hypothetical protein